MNESSSSFYPEDVGSSLPQKLQRKPGGWKGKIWIAPDFDETTPEILEMFYGDRDKNLF
jgi:hypothetical protein